MLQTIEAVIDKNGKVHLLETVKLEGPRRALVTILPSNAAKGDESGSRESIVGSLEIIDEDKAKANRESIVGLGEILDEDLEAGSREIAELFNRALEKSARELED